MHLQVRSFFIFILFISTQTIRILAGADIKQMQQKTMSQVIDSDFPSKLSSISQIKKPIIAAVNGIAVRS